MPAPQITRGELIAQLAVEYKRKMAEIKAISKEVTDIFGRLKEMVGPGQHEEVEYGDQVVMCTGVQTESSRLDEVALRDDLTAEQWSLITRPAVVLSLLDQAVKDREISPTVVNRHTTIKKDAPYVSITIKPKG